MASDDADRESTSPRRAWQGQESNAGGDARGSRRRFKLIVFTGVLSALVALVFVFMRYIGLPPAGPHFLAINVDEHNDKHFPIHAFARADSELLMQHFDEGKKKEATTRSKDLLCTELSGLKDRSVPSLVIYLTALALVRDESVYLLPVDAEPDDKKTWLDVGEVLKAVEQCPANHKLLILDLAHALVDPRLGVLADRVAETLEAYFRKEEPSFQVLCPCSAGQVSLTSEVLRSSVFAFYLDQGLLGAAAGKDGNISVLEIFEFVKPRVDRWARNNRGLRQEPRLFGKGDNFVIVPLGRAAPEKITLAAPGPYPAVLQDGWKQRDEARNRGALRQAPRQMLRLEANLLRHESRWQAGAAEKDLLDQETRDLMREVAGILPPPHLGSLSLANAKENPGMIDSFHQVLRQDVGNKKVQEELAKILQEDKNANYPQRARVVVEALSRLPDPFEQNHLKTVHAVLTGLKGKESFVEVLYVERLAGFAERENAENFQDARIENIWRTMRDREAALAALEREPEFLPWVAAAIESADKKRRGAESRLLWERPPAWPEALQDLKSARETYEEVTKTLMEMETGRTALDRALAELPANLRTLGDGPDADPLVEKIWLKAADEAAFLQAFFFAPAESRPSAAKLDMHGRELQQHLDGLSEAFRLRINGAEKADSPNAQRQLRCLLQGPLLNGQKRADLFNKLRISAKKLHDASEADDNPAANLIEKNAAYVRGDMSLALLRLGGLAEARDFTFPPPNEPGSLAARENQLHVWWGKVVKRWREAPRERKNDALGRLVSPWDTPAKGQDQGDFWQTKLREAHLQWLQRQYDSESLETGPRFPKKGEARDQKARDFYRNAAGKLAARLAD